MIFDEFIAVALSGLPNAQRVECASVEEWDILCKGTFSDRSLVFQRHHDELIGPTYPDTSRELAAACTSITEIAGLKYAIYRRDHRFDLIVWKDAA